VCAGHWFWRAGQGWSAAAGSKPQQEEKKILPIAFVSETLYDAVVILD
jgi:hypothetical protein